MLTRPESSKASTCGFFSREGWCARGFQNLPHTSAQRYRKCEEKPKSTNQAQLSEFCDLRFCCRKSGCAQRPSFFPALPENEALHHVFLQKNGFRDNIQLSRIRQRAVVGKPNNDPSLSPPHVESATTVLLGTFYNNARQYTASTSHSNTAQSHRICRPPWLQDFAQTV